MHKPGFLLYLLVMGGVTYLIRMLPFVFVRKKIANRYILSFLHYIPYAVLSAMTVPACFYAMGNVWSATAGVGMALVLAYRGKGLLAVAAGACAAVFLTELLILCFSAPLV